jgi:carboxylate-amine ligase
VTAVRAPRPRARPAPRPIEQHRFGSSADFSLGVEEELLVVDPATYRLKPDGPRLCATARPPRGRFTDEVFAAQLELVTPICADVHEANAALVQLRSAARTAGATLLAAGLHPSAPLGQALVNGGRRYAKVSAALAGILSTPACALQVHVGMPDPETAIRVANGMRRHVPLLRALAANSPFWAGADSGLASARSAIVRSYPRTEIPRPFRDWADFCATATELVSIAGVPDYTYIWWDIRPHPRLGTVEIRPADVQTSLESSIALTALIQALARLEAERPTPTPSGEALAECSFQATRHGLHARLLADDGSRIPAPVLARHRLTEVLPLARELGCDAALAGIERILRTGNGADHQRAAFRRGGLPELHASVVIDGGAAG